MHCSARPGDLILFAVGHHSSVNKVLDRLRLFVAHELGLVDSVSSVQPSVVNSAFHNPSHPNNLRSFPPFVAFLWYLVQACNSVGDWFPNVRVEWCRAEAWGLSFLYTFLCILSGLCLFFFVREVLPICQKYIIINLFLVALASSLHSPKPRGHGRSFICSCFSLRHGLQWRRGESNLFLSSLGAASFKYQLRHLQFNEIIFLSFLWLSDWRGKFENIQAWGSAKSFGNHWHLPRRGE